MGEPNEIYRLRGEGMYPCCKEAFMLEMYRRKGTGEAVHVNNDSFKCSTCNSEIVCDASERTGLLRWRWNGAEK